MEIMMDVGDEFTIKVFSTGEEYFLSVDNDSKLHLEKK